MDMKSNILIVLLVVSVISGCATGKFNAADRLVDSGHNVSRQIAYIEATQQELARHATTNEPDFSGLKLHTHVTDDGATNYYFHTRDAWLPVGAEGWFLFKCHSLHSEWNWDYWDIGDLSIGLDSTGQYYFNRDHVCGALGFAAPPSGHYSGIAEFLAQNRRWHTLPDDWKRTTPCAPDVDIASFIIGKWSGTATGPNGTNVVIGMKLGDRGCAHLDIDETMSYGASYTITSACTVEFRDDGFIGGRLRLEGNRLIGAIAEPVEDQEEMDRLMALRKTNTVEVIIIQTNLYTGVWNKIEKESIHQAEFTVPVKAAPSASSTVR